MANEQVFSNLALWVNAWRSLRNCGLVV